MSKCRYNLSEDCNNTDCLNCVLDKIRAEIDEQYDRVHPYNIYVAEGLEMALEIINIYNPESEDT